MLLQGGLFAVGIVILYFGAEWLVRGAGRLARSFGMSALVVGLTVVAIGTSAPELVVSILAVLRGQADLTVGNVIGSNISNIALILGISAVIYPIAVRARLLSRGIPLMIAATLIFTFMVRDGWLGRAGGGILLLALVGYFTYLLRSTDDELPEVEAEFEQHQEERGCCSEESRLWNTGLVFVGLVLLAGGAHLLVGAATFFATRIGLSELVVGLTVVAIGTSLPELATSVLAAFRKEADIAVGNAVGSNVLNILGVLGPAALLRPLAVSPGMLRFELPVMIVVSLLLLPLAWTRFRLERWEGVLLVGGYVVFIVVLLARSGAMPGA
ncbi:MAG TPA: calcium/sodium antiporter [Longimicrobiales bacterium]|nr:calcium/sodium antiporter [Longimicrobiales bacterium]